MCNGQDTLERVERVLHRVVEEQGEGEVRYTVCSGIASRGDNPFIILQCIHLIQIATS